MSAGAAQFTTRLLNVASQTVTFRGGPGGSATLVTSIVSEWDAAAVPSEAVTVTEWESMSSKSSTAPRATAMAPSLAPMENSTLDAASSEYSNASPSASAAVTVPTRVPPTLFSGTDNSEGALAGKTGGSSGSNSTPTGH